MVLSPRSSSKHNQMITRFIKHPKSTNFDGENDRPAKRPKLDAASADASPRRSAAPPKPDNRGIPYSDAEDDGGIEDMIKVEGGHRTDLESALPPILSDKEAIEEYEAFKASQEQDERKEDTGERLDEREWIRGKSSLYVDAFNLALETVLDEESHLFDEAEMDVFRQWRDMKYEAQYL